MKLLIITSKASEMSNLFMETVENCSVCVPGELPLDLERYDAFALLGGVDASPMVLWPDEREALEGQMRRGSKIFAEYVQGISSYDGLGVSSTRFARPVLVDRETLHMGLKQGALLDEQSNDRILPRAIGRTCTPILQYVDYPEGFYYMPEPEMLMPDETRFGLWLECKTLLVCSFRLSNFASAKFGPQRFWAELLMRVIHWLGGKCSKEKVEEYMRGAYHLADVACDPLETARRAVGWFEQADMIVKRGGEPYGVREGLSAHVRPDGTHVIGASIRNDCTGEAALMYYLKSRVDNDTTALYMADSLRRFPLSSQRKTGPWAGFLSWADTSYFASYQDDIARGFLLPELWRVLFSGDHTYLPDVKLTLDHLLSTTGTDGLRMCRVDYIRPDDETLSYMGLECDPDGKWHWNEWVKVTPAGEKVTAKVLRGMPSHCPSAHYNGTYMASLLLYGKLTGDEVYIYAGEKGMETLMRAYPQTAREHSQTQELCRLILPLALLHWVTGDPAKKLWLYEVADDLQAFCHPSGGFKEWDEGYTACCAGTKKGESSVLSQNGDPVADMMYSLTWLSVGLATARMVTRDKRFDDLWQEMAGFFSKTQIVSENKLLDGAWPRSIDLDYFEVYGVPNDLGWAPWSVESGWGVAEIASGILLNELFQRESFDRPEMKAVKE